jgi:hypothetical protein
MTIDSLDTIRSYFKNNDIASKTIDDIINELATVHLVSPNTENLDNIKYLYSTICYGTKPAIKPIKNKKNSSRVEGTIGINRTKGVVVNINELTTLVKLQDLMEPEAEDIEEVV